MQTIHPRDLQTLAASGQAIRLVDVRTPAEFREVHIPFAQNVPLDALDAAGLAREAEGATVYVVCRSGSRGRSACEKLSEAGAAVVNVEGGTLAWADAGLPVVRGKKAMSLERQVRIAAGFLVAAGTALAYFHDPLWAIVPGFVGCGLVFAGVTDRCGMAVMLGKMPWNQVSGATCATK